MLQFQYSKTKDFQQANKKNRNQSAEQHKNSHPATFIIVIQTVIYPDPYAHQKIHIKSCDVDVNKKQSCMLLATPYIVYFIVSTFGVGSFDFDWIVDQRRLPKDSFKRVDENKIQKPMPMMMTMMFESLKLCMLCMYLCTFYCIYRRKGVLTPTNTIPSTATSATGPFEVFRMI